MLPTETGQVVGLYMAAVQGNCGLALLALNFHNGQAIQAMSGNGRGQRLCKKHLFGWFGVTISTIELAECSGMSSKKSQGA